MPTFLVLLLSMLCFAFSQRQAQEGPLRGVLIAAGMFGLAVGLGISTQGNGFGRGLAGWLACLMAAGIITPFLATQVPRLQSLATWCRVRVLQAAFK